MEKRTILPQKQSRRLSCPNVDISPMIFKDKMSTFHERLTSVRKTQTSTLDHQSLQTLNQFTSPMESQPVRLQSGYTKNSLKTVDPRSVTSLYKNINFSQNKLTRTVSQPNPSKNEAQIITDFPIIHRNNPTPILARSSSTKSGGQGKRRGSTGEAIDSELRGLRRNSVEDRRLHQAVNKLDKQSFAGDMEFKQKIKEIFKDYNKILQRSPTADNWLLQHKQRSIILQERERQDIARRYSRLERQFRAPPNLHDAVSKIRSQAMIEAGLLTELEIENHGGYDDLVRTMESLNMPRRHSISGVLASNVPHIHQTDMKEMQSPYVGRRMTLADSRMLRDVLEFKADRMSRLYIDSFLNNTGLINKEQNSVVETSHLKLDTEESTNNLEEISPLAAVRVEEF